MTFLTMGAAGLRQATCPFLRVALQREERTQVRLDVGLGVKVGVIEKVGVTRTLVAAAAQGSTYMTSVWVQWGPGDVTFTLWMFLM